MANGNPPLSPARLIAVRLVRSNDTFPADVTPPAIERDIVVGSWSLKVHFGPIEQEVVRAIGIYDVGRNVILDSIFGRPGGSGDTSAQFFSSRDAEIDAVVDSYQLPEEWTKPEILYTTITASRQIKLPGDFDALPRHYWLRDDIAKSLTKYESEAEAVLGFAVARMMLGPPYRLSGPTFRECPRFFVAMEGRELSPVISLSGSATATVGHASWDDAIIPLTDRPFGLNETVPPKAFEAIGRMGQWHLLAYNESDPFRRFLWSYIGLEGIVDAVSHAGRDALSRSMSKQYQLGENVISDLLWPPDVRDTDPNRSVRFRFAIAAAPLSPETATEDVAVFAKINSFRNNIHGRLLLSSPFPAPEAFNLFERYSLLATRFLAQETGQEGGRDLASDPAIGE
jgi:hypothetical protein